MTEAASAPLSLVLDTNIVLDLLVFADPATDGLRTALALGAAQWLATAAMREELQRVLEYVPIRRRLASRGIAAAEVLAFFDERARLLRPPDAAPVRCSDPDDQKFIDLAAAHKCLLVSKDGAVLGLGQRLARHQVSVVAALAPASSYSLSED